MATATPGALLGLLMVFLILAILPLMLIRRDNLEEEAHQERSHDLATALKRYYKEAYDGVGSCTRCTEDGRAASVKVSRDTESRSLMFLSCPSCGSVLRAQSETESL